MSVVAVRKTKDKIEIASDSILVRYWTKDKSDRNYAKLFKVNGMIIGSVGLAEDCNFLHLFSQNRKPLFSTEIEVLRFFYDFCKWKSDNGGEQGNKVNDYFIVLEDKIFYISGFFIKEVKDYDAIGAGQDFALTALHLGYGVKEAVEIACHLSVFCELPIVYFEKELKNKKDGK